MAPLALHVAIPSPSPSPPPSPPQALVLTFEHADAGEDAFEVDAPEADATRADTLVAEALAQAPAGPSERRTSLAASSVPGAMASATNLPCTSLARPPADAAERERLLPRAFRGVLAPRPLSGAKELATRALCAVAEPPSFDDRAMFFFDRLTVHIFERPPFSVAFN